MTENTASARKLGFLAGECGYTRETAVPLSAEATTKELAAFWYGFEWSQRIKPEQVKTREFMLSEYGSPFHLPRDEIFAITSEHTPEIGDVFSANAYFDWSWPFMGFGQLSFSKDEETGELTCMNECMGRETVRKLLHAFADHLADNVKLEEE